jgi:hypothetical protein
MKPQNFVEGELPLETTIQFELSAIPTLSQEGGEPLRHILLGSPAGIRQTIHLLHNLHYVETARWSPLITIPNHQLIITPRQGEVMSLLLRHLRQSDG